ncbi:MAG: RluA family pseudouridine synthase [Acidobacteria bacterium]|nr:RluA family pseudouridine synthase [Acidobacteriota bacterium]
MTRNRGCTYRAQVGPEAAGRTVLGYLADTYAHSGIDEWTVRLQGGEIELDGRLARGDEALRAGQVLTWHRPPWHEPDVPLHFDVLFEDAAMLAVHKPSGLPTMPAGGFLDHTLLALVRARYLHAHPVHRLGRFTSGVVLFALSAEAAGVLGQAWREHRVTKRYRALGRGVPRWSEMEVTVPIGPVAHPRLGSVHAASAQGRPAHSTLRVVERRVGESVFDVRITTGRPHQIRIHLACAGHPLVGDPLYAEGGAPRLRDPGLPGDGGYLLHAYRLGLAHPATGQELDLVAPLPPGLEA